MLEYVPSHFKVIRHVRPKLSCRACETITQAPMPSLPIERGRPGPGLLAHVLVAKYCDHAPLYRQSAIYARAGVELDRSTLADWVGQAAFLLEPLAEAIARHVRAGVALHADDTPVPVLDPGRGKTKTGRLWVLVRDERPWGRPGAAGGRLTSTRRIARASMPRALLEGCQRLPARRRLCRLQRSLRGRSGERQCARLVEVACWAHSRESCSTCMPATGSPIAKEALERIAALFAIEAEIRGQAPSSVMPSARSAPARCSSR